jgi:fucose permease
VTREGISAPLWTAYLGFVAVGLSNNVLGASWLVLQPAFGQPLGSIGVLIAALMLGSLASSLASGWVLARLPAASYCTLGSLLAAVGLLGYLGPWWGLIVGATFVLGVGSGMLAAGLNTFVAAHYPASRMNWLHASFGLGSSLGPFLFTLWALSWGLPWRWTYAGIAGVYLGLAALTLRYRREWPPLRFRVAAGAEPRAGLRATLSLGAAWLGMALLFTHTGTSVSSGQLTGSLLNAGRGVPAEVAGNAAALYWACVTVGRLLVGAVVDRVGSERLLRGCTAGTVVGALALWLAPTPLLGFFGLAVMGLTLAPVYPTAISQTPQLVGPTLSAHAIGLQVAAGSLGSAALPGALSGAADWGGAALIAPGLVVFALVQFVAHEVLVRYQRRSISAPSVEV